MKFEKAEKEIKLLHDNGLIFDYDFSYNPINKITFAINEEGYGLKDIISKLKKGEKISFLINDGKTIFDKNIGTGNFIYNEKYDNSIYWENEFYGDCVRADSNIGTLQEWIKTEEEKYKIEENNMNTVNYCQTIPNSHYWTNLEQILQHHKYAEDCIIGIEPLTPEYLVIGFNNSRKKGYKLKQVVNKIDLNKIRGYVFQSIDEMINYINCSYFNLMELIYRINKTIETGINLTNGLKLEKQDVYKMVDCELNYQDEQWVFRNDENGVPDEEKSVAEWINYIEHHLNQAKEHNYYLRKDAALAAIRKVTALGVRTMMIHGCPERKTESNTKKESECCGRGCGIQNNSNIKYTTE